MQELVNRFRADIGSSMVCGIGVATGMASSILPFCRYADELDGRDRRSIAQNYVNTIVDSLTTDIKLALAIPADAAGVLSAPRCLASNGRKAIRSLLATCSDSTLLAAAVEVNLADVLKVGDVVYTLAKCITADIVASPTVVESLLHSISAITADLKLSGADDSMYAENNQRVGYIASHFDRMVAEGVDATTALRTAMVELVTAGLNNGQ